MSACVVCSRATVKGQTQCKACWAKHMRASDLEPRLEVIDRYKLVGERGAWSSEFDGWIEVQQCHARELTSYLRSRSGQRKVWPDTDHSLSCWMQAHRDPAHVCDCGAEKVRR